MNLLYGIYIYVLDTSSKGIKKGDYSVIYVKAMRRKKNGSDYKLYRKSKRNTKETKKRSGNTSPRYSAVDTSNTDVNAYTRTPLIIFFLPIPDVLPLRHVSS